MSFADRIAKDRGQPATVRIGTVVSLNPLLVSIQGTLYADVGVLDSYIPAVGHVVAALGQSAVSADGSSWLVLGHVLGNDAAALTAVTLATAVDTVNAVTASAVYVAVVGSFSPSLVFVGPPTGRVIIHWRAVTLGDPGAVGKMSFQIRLGSVIGSGTIVQAAADNMALGLFSNVASPEFGTTTLVAVTPGTTYNIEIQHRKVSGAGNVIFGNRQLMVQPAP